MYSGEYLSLLCVFSIVLALRNHSSKVETRDTQAYRTQGENASSSRTAPGEKVVTANMVPLVLLRECMIGPGDG